jgi:outer membrane protein assembly factor BamB
MKTPVDTIKLTTKTTIAILLALTIATTLVALPTVNAHDPAWTIPTWCYIAVTNNPIGVNQQLNVVFWINQYPPTAEGAYGDRWKFTVEVTKPDGSKETVGPITSDPVGGGYAAYTPTQVGTYTFVAKFPDTIVTGTPAPPGGFARGGDAYIGDTYLASESNPLSVTVQEEQIQPRPETPLPTQYWTRPINDANRDWYVLAGNWLSGAAQNVNSTTLFCYGEDFTESAHVMWATPMWAGGIMDERFGDTGYQTAHYEGLGFTPPIILNGKIYYNVQSNPKRGWYCLDLYTGETLYFHNTTGPVVSMGGGFDAHGTITGESLSFGQIYNYEAPNQHGGFPYLWSTSNPNLANSWMMFDAYSGDYICTIANVSSRGTQVYGKDGSILVYNLANIAPRGAPPNYYLQVWNTSRAIWWKSEWYANTYWMWRPYQNYTFDGNNGFSLNVSIPDVSGASIRAVREDQYVIIGTTGKNNGTYTEQGWLCAFSLKAGQEGTKLWNITFTPPESVPDIAAGAGMFGSGVSMGTVDPEDGVFLFEQKMTLERWGYSLETGQLLWKSQPEKDMNYYGMSDDIYDGKLFSYGYSGQLIAYDIKTGDIVWIYNASQVGFESPYGDFPINIAGIADGKIYLVSGEHSPTQPLWRGPNLRCINATDGTEIWKIMHWGAGIGGAHLTANCVVLADGYVVGLDLYDNQIYCYGKGPSATTVSAPQTVITQGQSVMITGTVTDECAGAKAVAEKMGFVNGVPAVSDEDQGAWMEYLYKQQAIPANAKGVEVTLDAVDPNGNFVHIGTVTSDMSGSFKKMYTPDVPGEYTIIATFAGSKAYYSSYAQTYVGVSEAPASTTPATETTLQESPMLTYVLAAVIVLIIAVFVAIVLLLRRK